MFLGFRRSSRLRKAKLGLLTACAWACAVSCWAAARPLTPETARTYGAGFVREGTDYVCDNGSDTHASRGVSWHVVLDQERPTPLVFTAEGRAEDRDAGPSGGFSLYLDITYCDGGHLWGQQAAFDSDPAAGWQTRTVDLFPEKPIRSISAYLLQRGRPGRVRFRNPRWESYAGRALFDRRPAAQMKPLSAPGFLARDVAAGADFAPPDQALVGVTLAHTVRRDGDAQFFDVTLAATDARDHALTLLWACPIAPGADWLADLRTRLPVAQEHMTVSTVPCGTGALSRWPFGAVDQQGKGLALGIDPTAPAFFRVVANGPARCLFIAFDVGLAPEHPTAHLRFCTFGFDGTHGLRGALARYQQLFPEASHVRVLRQGIWMPFHAVSQVKGWEDFGFCFKEGDGETAWDDAHGLLTFRYTEPCTWWMPLAGDLSRQTVATAADEAARRAATGHDALAAGWRKSAFHNRKGLPVARFLDTPWCKGAVWSVNSAPGLGGDWAAKNAEPAFTQRYAGTGPDGVDGEYVDSAELYVTDTLDYNRANFAGMKTPLCFDRTTHQVAIFKGLIAYEYVRGLAERVWPKGRYMMANATPTNWCWLAPYLDVMGTETDWNPGRGATPAQWHPMSDADLLYRRALCGGKPYCFLMNTDFDRFPSALTEKFMQRALAYGMFPGFFSADAATGHYFSRPALYERDRPLFKKYVPLCRRVAEAGWQPVNRLVASTDPLVVTEQFGSKPGARYATVFNLSREPRTVNLRRGVADAAEETPELVEGVPVRWQDNRATLALPGESVRVLCF